MIDQESHIIDSLFPLGNNVSFVLFCVYFTGNHQRQSRSNEGELEMIEERSFHRSAVQVYAKFFN